MESTIIPSVTGWKHRLLPPSLGLEEKKNTQNTQFPPKLYIFENSESKSSSVSMIAMSTASVQSGHWQASVAVDSDFSRASALGLQDKKKLYIK